MSSTDDRCETSSEYTRASRTRRAISCEYCPPRSTTRTGRSSAAAASRAGRGRTSAAPVIGCVLRDRHVVRMRLTQARARDAHEARLLQRVDGRGAAVAHSLTQAADDLMQHGLHRPLVRHARLDALGDELVDVLDVALEVAVLRKASRLHRAERAHAAEFLEPLALHND